MGLLRDAVLSVPLPCLSWSSVEPSLISTAWENSYSRGGNVAVHHWRGLGKGGLNRLEDWVEKSAANSLDD
jgi:WD repeat-containing protein 23